MSAPPILFFDSGVGGFSVVAHARAALPLAPFVYAADAAGFPYGTRTEAEIAARVPALLARLAARYQPQLIVIACNTASTIALAAARAALDVPIVGTVPAIKPAAALSRTRVIGVLGTDATVRQAYVDDLTAKFASDCEVVRHGSAALVELAESKLHGEVVAHEAVRVAVARLACVPELDTVVLACTHFPLLADELAEALPGVALIDSGEGIARRVAFLARGEWQAGMMNTAVFTGPPTVSSALRAALEQRGFSRVEFID